MRKLAALVAMNLLIALQAVNSQNILYNYFPEKIKVLVAFKPLEIGSKIPPGVFSESPFVKSREEKENDKMLAILRDIRSIGIQLDEAFVIVSEGSEPGMKITHLLARLENPSAFRNFLVGQAKIDPGMIRTYGTDNVFFPEEGTVVAWNNKVLVLASEKGYYDMTDAISDTMTEIDYEKWFEESKEKKQKSLRNLAFELLTPRPGNAFAFDPKFQALMKEPGEMKIWNQDNSEPLGMVIPAPQILAQLSKLTTGLKTTAVEFAPGKIIVRTRAYPGEEMAALMEKNPPAPAGEEFLDAIPEGKILAFANGSISNALLQDLFNKPVFRELADSVKKYSSFDIRQLPSIFGNKGVAAVVYNKGAEPEIDLIIGIPIRDLAGYTSMHSEVGRLIDSLKKEDSSGFTKKFRPVVRNNDRMLAISLSEKTAQNFLDKKGTQPVPAHFRAYAKHPAFLNLDLPELIRTFIMKEVKEKAPEELTFLSNLGDVRVYGGEFREGATTMTAEINFKDPDQNSLAQIFGIMNGLMEMMMKNKDSREEDENYEYEMDATDTSMSDNDVELIRYLVPDLKDSKAREVLEDYTDAVIAYGKTLSDSAVDIEAKKNYLLWQERARVTLKNLTDKEDAKAFSEFLLMLENLLKEYDPANKEDD